MFKNLIQLIDSMPDEKACREFLIKERWNGVIACPYCKHEGAYVIEGGKRFKCQSGKCYKKFSVTVGTVMEASKVSLKKWLTAIYLVTANKKGISSYQLARHIGVRQLSAWFMIHRIREMVRVKDAETIGLGKIVEADETFVGGSISNKHNKKRKAYAENPDLFPKTIVLGMIERDGNMVAKVIPNKIPHEVATVVADTIEKKSILITDTANLYSRISSNYEHYSVNHSINEYARDNIHTNSIEGAFSHFKRTIYGTHHSISPKHTQRYCDEFTFRYNNRKMKDADRFLLSLQSMEGRLTYKALIKPQLYQSSSTQTFSNKNNGKGIFQLKDGEVVGFYTSAHQAAKKTGIDESNIKKVARGKNVSAGGFTWKYA